MHIKALYASLLFLSLLFAGTLYFQSRLLFLPRPSLSKTLLPDLSQLQVTSCISFGFTYTSGDVVDMPCDASSRFASEIYRHDNGNLYLVIHGLDSNNRTTTTLKKFATAINLPDLYASRFIRLSGGERYIVLRTTEADNTTRFTMYYNEEPVLGVDWLTFSLIGVHDFPKGGIDISDGTRPIVYAKDKNHVYYKARVILDADPETFVFVPSGVYRQEYGKDKNQAYYLNFALEKSDPATFKPLGTQPYEGVGIGPYAKDKIRAYYKDKLIPEADVKTFEAKVEGYAKDKNRVYKDGEVLPDADPNTFVFPEPSIG